MPTVIVSKLEEKLEDLFNDQQFEFSDLDRTIRSIRSKRTNNKSLPPSLHFDVSKKDCNLHLRVLVFKGATWDRVRLNCLRIHKDLYRVVQRRKISFQVPQLIEFGESPLLWDVSERVEAVNLRGSSLVVESSVNTWTKWKHL